MQYWVLLPFQRFCTTGKNNNTNFYIKMTIGNFYRGFPNRNVNIRKQLLGTDL